MAKTKETGHAKNVANFEDLIDVCKSYGTSYNPSREEIKIESLSALLINAQNAMEALKSAERSFGNRTNDRELAFDPLGPLTTRIVGALESSGANALTIEDARAILNKQRGNRSTPLPTPVPQENAEAASEPRTRSTSQRGFDNQEEHFKKLITAVSSEPKYKPNEPELTVQNLKAVLADLTVKNKLAGQAETALNNARILRDELLYGANTGIYDTVGVVKSYAVSAYGATHKRYKQLTKFRFTKPSSEN